MFSSAFSAPLWLNSCVNKDKLTKERRSWNMSRICGKNTTPEKIVRSLLHKMGYRFRLHVRIPIPFSASDGETQPLGKRREEFDRR